MRVSRTYFLTVPAVERNREKLKETENSRFISEGEDGDPQPSSSRGGSMAFMSSVENRKTMLIFINFALLVISLLLIGTGASLMGFYRIHLLEIITVDFLIVPILMTGGGLLTLIIFFTGMTALAKEDNCWLLAFSILTSLNFFVLLAGVISSIRLVVEIQIGFLNAEVIPELSRYETEDWVRYKWDTIQSEFMCCGGYGHHQGYTDWKHTFMGDSKKSVPDSCCLFEAPGCGQNLFEITDIRVIVQKINIHGCLFVMKKRLDTHVTAILMIFAGAGSILAIVELFSVVLACCLASSFQADEEEELAMSHAVGGGSPHVNVPLHYSMSDHHRLSPGSRAGSHRPSPRPGSRMGSQRSIYDRERNEEERQYYTTCESKCL